MYLASFAFALPFMLVGTPILVSLFILPFVFFILFKKEILKTPSFKRWEKIVLTPLVLLAYLWLTARYAATFVPGGGIGFMVGVYALYTFVPAVIAITLIDLFVIARNYSKKWVIGTVTVGVVLFGAVVGIRWWNHHYYVNIAWVKQCQDAGDRFFYDGTPIDHLRVINMGFSRAYEYKFRGKKKDQWSARTSVKPAEELLKRGVIQEYTQIWKNNSRKPEPELTRLVDNEAKAVEADSLPEASHEVSQSKETIKVKEWRNYQKYTTTVRNLNTGHVIAKRVHYERTRPPAMCGDMYGDTMDVTDFLHTVIVDSATNGAH